jgi:hypothetical protein
VVDRGTGEDTEVPKQFLLLAHPPHVLPVIVSVVFGDVFRDVIGTLDILENFFGVHIREEDEGMEMKLLELLRRNCKKTWWHKVVARHSWIYYRT